MDEQLGMLTLMERYAIARRAQADAQRHLEKAQRRYEQMIVAAGNAQAALLRRVEDSQRPPVLSLEPGDDLRGT